MDGGDAEINSPAQNEDEASARTSISSNASDSMLHSPSGSAANTLPQSRPSIDDIDDLSRLALSRRLSTLSATSSFGDIGDGNLNWNPREVCVNGISPQTVLLGLGVLRVLCSDLECVEQCAVACCKTARLQANSP
jgi:hypothetical protein